MARTINSTNFALAKQETLLLSNKKNAPVAQLVEHLTLNQRVQGSNPCRRTKKIISKNDAPVAQLVEHLTLNQRVQGSNPCRRTKKGDFGLLFLFSYTYYHLQTFL